MNDEESKNGVEGAWYQERRRHVEVRAAGMLVDTANTITSSSGRYQLTVQHLTSDKHGWNYSRGIVTRLSDSVIIASVLRDYGAFWHAWLLQGDEEYLLCGEHYQGYMAIRLSTAEQCVYCAEEASVGAGFCWAVVKPSPSQNIVAVDGCYWAAPYEIRFYDVSRPMTLPYPLLSIIDLPPSDEPPGAITWDKTDDICYVNVMDDAIETEDGWREVVRHIEWRRETAQIIQRQIEEYRRAQDADQPV